MSKRVFIDIDGVLADFNAAYADLLEIMGGVQIDRTPPWPTVWAWPQAVAPAEVCTSSWHFLSNTPEWWETIPPYEEAVQLRDYGLLEGLLDVHDVYFLTARPAVMRDASQAWLEQLIGRGVTVIATDAPKGPLVMMLGGDVLIDDKPENLENGPATRCLIRRPWNLEHAGGQSFDSVVEGLLDAEIRDGRYSRQ